MSDSQSTDVLALVPPPPGFSVDIAINKLVNARLEKIKREYENQLKEVEQKHEDTLERVNCELSDLQAKQQDLQAQLYEANNWTIHGVCPITSEVIVLCNPFRILILLIESFYAIYWTKCRPC